MIDLLGMEEKVKKVVSMGCGSSYVATALDVIELINRLRQAEKDSARYRWLRDTAGVDGTADLMISIIASDEWDSLIDEEIQCSK